MFRERTPAAAQTRINNIAFFLGLLSLGFSAGCARDVAQFSAWQPAASHLPGVARLAVLPLDGEPAVAKLAQASIAARVHEAQLYTLVDGSRVGRAPAKSALAGNSIPAMNAGRQLGADAVLVASIEFQEANGSPYGAKAIEIGDTVLVAAVAYQVLDVRTGAVLADGEAKETFRGEFNEEESGATSSSKVAAQLVREASKKTAEQLVPSRQTREVELAGALMGKGAGAVRAGNRLAKQGKWQRAITQWQTAVNENPECHAAHYNLGLAQESQGNLMQAKQHYQQALAIEQEELYAEASQRAEQLAQQAARLSFQLASRNRPRPAIPAWPQTVAAPAGSHPATPVAYPRTTVPQMPYAPAGQPARP